MKEEIAEQEIGDDVDALGVVAAGIVRQRAEEARGRRGFAGGSGDAARNDAPKSATNTVAARFMESAAPSPC